MPLDFDQVKILIADLAIAQRELMLQLEEARTENKELVQKLNEKEKANATAHKPTA